MNTLVLGGALIGAAVAFILVAGALVVLEACLTRPLDQPTPISAAALGALLLAAVPCVGLLALGIP